MNFVGTCVCDEWLHNQKIFLPNSDEWVEILKTNILDDFPAPDCSLISAWLQDYSPYQEARLGLSVNPHLGWIVIPLLQFKEGTFRVHFENVICEHCGQRNGPSACPDFAAYAGTGYSDKQVWEAFSVLPIKSCKFCGHLLQKRQTIWLGEESMH